MLAIANKNKEALEYRQATLQHKRKIASESSLEIESDLHAIIAQIASLETVIAALSDGPVKKENISDKKTAEYRLFKLQERKENNGVLALLQTEADKGCVEKHIDEINTFINGVFECLGSL